MNKMNWQAFPFGLVLELTLELPEQPTIHQSAIPATLTVTLPVQITNTFQVFYDDCVATSLGFLNQVFRRIVKNPPDPILLKLTILLKDFASDPHIVTPYVCLGFTTLLFH